MIKRLFSRQSKTITGAAIILAGASFISRIVGFLRDRIFAHQFGAGDTLDIYYAAFRVPDTVYNLIVIGALSAGFIPVFSRLMKKNAPEALRVTNSVINVLGAFLVTVSTLLFIFTPYIMPFLVPGFEGEKMEMTILLTRIMFLSPIILGISGIFSSVLQTFKAFVIYALTPIVYNIGIIVGALVFEPIFGIKGLAFGVILGALLHLLIQLPALRHYKFSYQWVWDIKNKHVREIGRSMIPRTLALATNQVNLLVITIIISTLAAGSLTVFNFASNIQFLALGVIGYAFANAAFPTFAALAAEHKTKKLIEHISRTIRQILFFAVPLTVIFLLLRAQIVRVLFGTGAFDWAATNVTANTLAFFSLSLIAQCLIPLLSRVFYVLHDTWTPFVIGVISTLVNVVFALIFKDSLGIAGLALAFSISMLVQAALLWIVLRVKKLKSLQELRILHFLYKIILAGMTMAAVVQMLKYPLSTIVDMTRFWGIFTQGAIAGTIGLLVYFVIGFLFELEEVQIIMKSLKRQWLKLQNVQVDINEADNI